ncbi:MAG: response regulator transcription factor [Bacteroidales bacterium]|nr:response regulator transcription factor [Bacteroidales bacterium]
MKNKLNILIADDHEFFVDGVEKHILNINFVGNVYKASSGTKALEIINTNKIDVLISDIAMPELNGIELTKKLRLLKKQIKIIIVTQFSDRQHILPLLKQNIDAIIDKAEAKNELERTFQAISLNIKYYSPIIQKTANSILLGSKVKKNTGVIPNLTRREKEFLPYISQGLSNKEVVELLERQPNKIILSPQTIESHRKNLYLKFDVHNSAQLLKKAIDFGFIL